MDVSEFWILKVAVLIDQPDLVDIQRKGKNLLFYELSGRFPKNGVIFVRPLSQSHQDEKKGPLPLPWLLLELCENPNSE